MVPILTTQIWHRAFDQFWVGQFQLDVQNWYHLDVVFFRVVQRSLIFWWSWSWSWLIFSFFFARSLILIDLSFLGGTNDWSWLILKRKTMILIDLEKLNKIKIKKDHFSGHFRKKTKKTVNLRTFPKKSVNLRTFLWNFRKFSEHEKWSRMILILIDLLPFWGQDHWSWLFFFWQMIDLAKKQMILILKRSRSWSLHNPAYEAN